mmetsp:Transcript_89980/g.263016  ORF Transcript_89980/g.263016 Transcript_89980/m.263016 type:complete len:327 (+) Transcript_89980:962-1942(+)
MRHNELGRLPGNLPHALNILHSHLGWTHLLLPVRPIEILRVLFQRGRTAQLLRKVERLHKGMVSARVQRFLECQVNMVQVHDKLCIDLPGHAPLDEFVHEVHRLRSLVRLLRALLQLPGQALDIGLQPCRSLRFRRRCYLSCFFCTCGGPLRVGPGVSADHQAPRPCLQLLHEGSATGGHAILEGAGALEDGAVAAHRLLDALRRLVHRLQHPHQRLVRRRRRRGVERLGARVGGRELLELAAQGLQVADLAERTAVLERRAAADGIGSLCLDPLQDAVVAGIGASIGEGRAGICDCWVRVISGCLRPGNHGGCRPSLRYSSTGTR